MPKLWDELIEAHRRAVPDAIPGRIADERVQSACKNPTGVCFSRAPETLTRERHGELQGRETRAVGSKIFRALLVALHFVAPSTSSARDRSPLSAAGSTATLSVESPADLRGGLIFQARIAVHALKPIARPTLILDPGWFESMSLNAIAPDPAQQSTRTARRDLGRLVVGERLAVSLYFQTNLAERCR